MGQASLRAAQLQATLRLVVLLPLHLLYLKFTHHTDPHQNISLPIQHFLGMHPLADTPQVPTQPLVTLPIFPLDTHFPVCLQIMAPLPLQVYLARGHIPPEEFHHIQEYYEDPRMTCIGHHQEVSLAMGPPVTQVILTSS